MASIDCKNETNPKLSLTSNRLDTNLHKIGLSHFPNKKTVPRSHLPLRVELASDLELDHYADLDQINQLLPVTMRSGLAREQYQTSPLKRNKKGTF